MRRLMSLWESGMPGFRFSPTEQELVGYFLKRAAEGRKAEVAELIITVDLYKHDPWELPELAPFGEKEWFFFVPRDRKYPNGTRPNRVTKSGYWKATGTDRPVMSNENESSTSNWIGLKKTLVFYNGKAPKGIKTQWIMNEYRLHDSEAHRFQNDVTLCRLYCKGTRVLGACYNVSRAVTPPEPSPVVSEAAAAEESVKDEVPKIEEAAAAKNEEAAASKNEQSDPGSPHSVMLYGFDNGNATPYDCPLNAGASSNGGSGETTTPWYYGVARLGLDKDEFNWNSANYST